ncbi:MgtC/SapB family protein [Allomesorhizobium alhagi]|jgi:putative Mg2+ transporter-C (MgtC) family protein|uniref:Protein MgtC n=1 Tax=Mesorhizobium alhagi CCNWXJ12-2 TaxID=1107882 RepID=H0HL84_9HYPH|nr:MgtC/SapB family protein [Mesorhizobium alhagi]EHK58568.1 MgtC/SapB transporter [Mesorhizobium alhagi CCNWXJ12-2]
MEALVEEFGHPTYTSFPVIVARLLLATVFGAVIGFEREWRNRPAGLRTHILVCVAAATVGILTIEIIHAPMFSTDAVTLDPIRAVEAVTAGVAFLAAGTILFARGQVHGLTTGAGMWLAGAIGLSAGLGFWQIATFGTLLALIVLGLLKTLESRLDLDEGPDFKNSAAGGKDAERRIEPKPDDPSHMQPSERFPEGRSD